MASTNKTPRLGLNQWAAGDPVLREDFNGDNAKLETAVVALQNSELKYTTGTFTGDGLYPRRFPTPGKPIILLLDGFYNAATPSSPNYGRASALCFEYAGIHFTGYASVDEFATLHADGFSLTKVAYFNELNKNGRYVCIYI